MYDDTPKQANRPTTIREEGVRFFTEYVNAKADYDEACQELLRARTMRDEAAKRLSGINQRVSDMVGRAMNDPTEPQPNAPISGNSGIGNYGR